MTTRAWLLTLRAFSFPATIVPVLLALVVVLASPMTVTWWTVPVYLLAALLFHAATNVLNDYYDYRHGVDREDDRDPTHAITQGHATPRFMFVSGHLYFVAALILGLGLAGLRGTDFLVAGLVGAAGSYFYTAGRLSLKYRALGDLTVFVMMGPALVVLGVWTFAGQPSLAGALASLPVALLVTLILHGNNYRDIGVDRRAGVTTLAGLLGERAARRLFTILLLGSYLSAAVLAAVGVVPWWSLLAFASAPAAWQLERRVRQSTDAGELVDLPMRCAMLHLQFGVLYILGFLIQWVL